MEKEFEEIYREYYPAVYRFLLKLTNGDVSIAEELTQETFFQVFLSIHRYRGECHFFTWVCQIAKNCYFKYLRRNRECVMDVSKIEERLHLAPAAEDVCEIRLLKKQLRREILRMRKKQRDILILRIYCDCSFQEIGRLLKMEENAVKVSYHRSKKKLKTLFVSKPS